jgi:ssDNA-binding Zn-finger/Zn-ribbon topoisomerase 1
MGLKFPDSMDECIYFTRRVIGKGKIVAWVFREDCPKCKKALMGKPKGDEGNIKIRAKEYVCPACNYTVSKEEYEPTLTCSIQYTCPKCGNQGEAQTPYKRKTFEGVPSIVFQCSKCNEKIGITKKMKASKKKGEPDLDDD